MSSEPQMSCSDTINRGRRRLAGRRRSDHILARARVSRNVFRNLGAVAIRRNNSEIWVVSTCGVISRQSCVRNLKLLRKGLSQVRAPSSGKNDLGSHCRASSTQQETLLFAVLLCPTATPTPDSHPHTQPARLYHLDYTDCAASQKNSSKFLRNLGALSAQLVKEIWVPGERNSGPSQHAWSCMRADTTHLKNTSRRPTADQHDERSRSVSNEASCEQGCACHRSAPSISRSMLGDGR